MKMPIFYILCARMTMAIGCRADKDKDVALKLRIPKGQDVHEGFLRRRPLPIY